MIFGHIGDRVGRKQTLVATMPLMGVATALIGLLPPYAAIGVAAPPLLLVLLRILQGVAVGGEWGGAGSTAASRRSASASASRCSPSSSTRRPS